MTFAVAVGVYLNVTVLTLPIGHAPENVAARTCFGCLSDKRLSNVSGDAAAGVSSAWRTTRATRSALSRVNCTASKGFFWRAMRQVGGVPKSVEKLASEFTRKSWMYGKLED